MDSLQAEVSRMKAIAEYGNKPRKEGYWTTVEKPKVLAALAQIDAPDEWKKMVIAAEKLATTAKNLLDNNRTSIRQIYLAYGDKWNSLMKLIGNPEVGSEGESHPYYQQWAQYTKIRGLVIDFNFSDVLA